jgi:hypothetical protein
MEAVHERVAGIDVHRMKHVVTVLIEQADATVSRETREFGGSKRPIPKSSAASNWLNSATSYRLKMSKNLIIRTP